MKIIADLHIHSKYSRATSKQMQPEDLEIWASRKGIDIIGTGDSSHPGWVKELKEKLEEKKPGLYQLKSKYSQIKKGQNKPYFLLTGELSTIYKHSHAVRKIHTLLWTPNFTVLEKINKNLAKLGNIAYDGRPIIGITAHELAKIYWENDPFCEIIPAHVWTPWFGLFGSKSGYNKIEECYGQDVDKIHALETGLSSDPQMNWQVSQNDRYTLISNSDAHSLPNIGREANIFDLKELNYENIVNAVRTKNGFVGTIEFYPEEGMYHNDGHRACKINLNPNQAKKLKNICPACGKPLTLGVLHRVLDLSDRASFDSTQFKHRVWYAIPLLELIAEACNTKSKLSKNVLNRYEFYTAKMSEFEILLFADTKQLTTFLPPDLVYLIEKMRQNEVNKIAGYDGEYGKITISKPRNISQKGLF